MAGINLFSWFKKPETPIAGIKMDVAVPAPERPQPTQTREIVFGQPMASWDGYAQSGRSAPILNTWFNGENERGSMGPALRQTMDNAVLGTRAWQLFITSETCHTIIKQKGKWVLGKGLILQSSPKADILAKKGIKIDSETWSKDIESLWDLVSNKSTMMDYANRVSLHKIAKRIERNMSIWGYVLVVHRITKNNIVTTQLIDGQWVVTPAGTVTIGSNTYMVDNKVGYDWVYPKTGNRIRNGVEISATGEHEAYWVRDGIGLTYKRISAKSGGLLMAYMCYGDEHRLESTTAIPIITPNMESSKQIDDYTAATLATIQERANLTYFITHEKGTEEKDPRQGAVLKIVGTRGEDGAPPITTESGQQLENRIFATTRKQTYNMPAGANIESPDFKQEVQYKEFHDTRFYADCATVGIPPEVASQLYGGSYSASRAATNGWQFMLNIDRDDFGNQFYQRVYNLQLLVWVLAGEVQAPGYLEAFYKGDALIIAAYQYANWQGDPVPQIDELKEIQAKRLLLGLDSANIPLGTFEKVCQDLGEGDFKEILKQYIEEKKEATTGGILIIPPKGTTESDTGEDKKE